MIRYLVKRLAQSLLTIFLTVSTVFVLVRLAPGDPAKNYAGPFATTEQVEEVRRTGQAHGPPLPAGRTGCTSAGAAPPRAWSPAAHAGRSDRCGDRSGAVSRYCDPGHSTPDRRTLAAAPAGAAGRSTDAP